MELVMADVVSSLTKRKMKPGKQQRKLKNENKKAKKAQERE